MGEIMDSSPAYIAGVGTEEPVSEDPKPEEPKVEISNVSVTMNFTYMKSIFPGKTDEDLRKIAAVKFVGPDKIFHYPFMWGNENVADLAAEFFTKETNLWDATLKNAQRPLTWNHAQDPSFKASPIVGKTTDFGDDEIGRWALSTLDTSHRYYRAISELIERGIIGTSSDSAPQYVEKEDRGKAVWLKTWPWFASALTATPCEPRMVGTIEFFKSLGITLPSPEASGEQVRTMQMKAQAIFMFSEIFGDAK